MSIKTFYITKMPDKFNCVYGFVENSIEFTTSSTNTTTTKIPSLFLETILLFALQRILLAGNEFYPSLDGGLSIFS